MLAWKIFCLLLASQWGNSLGVIKFIQQAAKKSDASLLRIWYKQCPEDWLQQLLETSPYPVVLQTQNNLILEHNSKALQVICLSNDYKSEWLKQLNRNEKTIIFLQEFSSKELKCLLKNCHQLKMQQVMALQWKEDKDLLSYFTYSPQPHFTLEQHSLRNFSNKDLQYFNMQAQPLIVMPDQWHPRSMVYVDKRTGELVLRGSVGRFVELLAWKLNATMKFALPIRPGQVLHPNEVLRLSRELPIDIPVSMTLASKPEHIRSYPFELTHICLMIPLSQQLPLKEIYRLLANVQNILIALAILYGYGFFLSLHEYFSVGIGSWVDFLLNDRAFRGLLGQSFHLSLSSCRSVSLKAVYFSLSIMGLYLSCIYEAALGTMLTHPPKRFQPRTVNDLREVGLRMAINEADVAIGMEMDVPLHTVNGSEFTRLRDSFNISHVYLASRLHWTLFNQQQKYFEKELFLYSMDACLSTLTLMTFPLIEDSWFAEHITRLNFAVRANGIYQYFVGMHFHDMASAGLVSFKDLSQSQRPDDRHGVALNLDDLKWISYAYVVLLMFAFLVLALEIMWKRFA